MIQVSKDFRSQFQGRLCLKSLEYLTKTKESSEVDAVTPHVTVREAGKQ